MVSLVFEGDEAPVRRSPIKQRPERLPPAFEAQHLEFFQKQLGFELAEYADREVQGPGAPSLSLHSRRPEAAIQSRLEALSLPQAGGPGRPRGSTVSPSDLWDSVRQRRMRWHQAKQKWPEALFVLCLGNRAEGQPQVTLPTRA